MVRRAIIITAEDHQQLESLVRSDVTRLVSGAERVDELQFELNRAEIVPQNQVPANVVTMNSTIVLRDLDTNEVDTYTLVYPERADIANQRLSVLAPIGTAVLGYRVGDQIRWQVPAGWRTLKVEKVVFRPERDQGYY